MCRNFIIPVYGNMNEINIHAVHKMKVSWYRIWSTMMYAFYDTYICFNIYVYIKYKCFNMIFMNKINAQAVHKWKFGGSKYGMLLCMHFLILVYDILG